MTSSSSSRPWATRRTNCSASPRPSPTNPDPRELDVLLATGEHQSATLVSMALHALGVQAISLTGPQAGITTDGTLRPRAHRGHRAAPVRAELEDGKVVIVAGFQGQSARADGATSWRSRRSVVAAATPRRSRSPPRLRPIDARSSPTSAASSRRIHGSSRPRASSRSSATRRCSSSPTRAPRSCRSGPSSWAGSTPSSSRS